jgi:hypothetical protein
MSGAARGHMVVGKTYWRQVKPMATGPVGALVIFGATGEQFRVIRAGKALPVTATEVSIRFRSDALLPDDDTWHDPAG